MEGSFTMEAGNVLIVEKKLLSFPLSPLLIDQFIAEIAGQKEERKDLEGKLERKLELQKGKASQPFLFSLFLHGLTLHDLTLSFWILVILD